MQIGPFLKLRSKIFLRIIFEKYHLIFLQRIQSPAVYCVNYHFTVNNERRLVIFMQLHIFWKISLHFLIRECQALTPEMRIIITLLIMEE